MLQIRNVKKFFLTVTVLMLMPGCGLASFGEKREGDPGERQTLLHQGIDRHYVVRVSGNLKDGKVPLVLVLHGGGGNAANAESMTGFTQKAEQAGFIVVYPEGTGRLKGKFLTWNAGHCCGYAMEKRVDDVGFIDALIERLVREYPIDPKRIYATGMSNGGMMVHRLGIELSNRFAAIAPVVATMFGDEKSPGQPVSAVMINGMLDKAVPHQGGVPGGRFPDAWNGASPRPAEEQAVFWAAANDCGKSVDRDDESLYTHWQYHCPSGRGVEHYLVKDGGHAWYGGRRGSFRGDDPGTSLNNTDVIWKFFKAHSK